MSTVIIESEFRERLAEFQNGPEFAEFCGPNTKVESGTSEGHEFVDEGSDDVRYGILYWLILSDPADEDNATYRITAEGKCVCHATGVEV